jgi:RHS repeat-associated protein
LRLLYDGSGALIRTTNALGQVTAITAHTPGGLPTRITDANGVATTLSYDGRQHLTSSVLQTSAGLLATTNTYDLAEELASTTLPDGSKITYSYDGFHRLASVSDLFGNQIQYTHDVEGDLVNTTIPGTSNPFGIPGLNLPLLARSNTFDALRRLSQSVDGIGGLTTFPNVTSYTRDANGNALTVTDGDGHAAQQAFDGLNRLNRVIDALGGITKLTYDAHDRPVTVVDPNSGSTTFVYNGFGDVIQRISPDTGTTKYYYDADGNLTQMIDGRGVVTNYTYDALDRVLTTTFPGDSAENVAYRYDEPGHGFGIGRLTSLTDEAGTLSRTTDERGNILSEQRIHGSSISVTGYAYDAANRVASIIYPSGWTVSYARDVMGRVQSMSALPPSAGTATPILSGVTWQPFGPVSGFAYGNGITETRSFDLGYRMTGVTDTGTTPVQSLSYFLDPATNVYVISDGVTPGNSQSFGYDALNHLTSATGGYGNLAWTYTPIGNRLTETANSVVTSYTYAAHSNQLTKITTGSATQAIVYTASGNMSAITPNTGVATVINYNAANRPASVTGTPVAITAMVYDAFGHRLSKTSAGTTNYFTYGRDSELLEENENGFPIDYVYLDGRPVAENLPSSGKVYFLHDDRLGTPQLATDAGQNVVWGTTHQPFGQTTLPSGTITQNLRFPGQYADAETEWNYNGFRDYVPALGRYIESDPIGIYGGINTYLYANANPPRFTDPSGTDWRKGVQALTCTVFFICASPNNPEFNPSTEYPDKATTQEINAEAAVESSRVLPATQTAADAVGGGAAAVATATSVLLICVPPLAFVTVAFWPSPAN